MPFKLSISLLCILGAITVGCGRGASSNLSSLDNQSSRADTIEVSTKQNESTDVNNTETDKSQTDDAKATANADPASKDPAPKGPAPKDADKDAAGIEATKRNAANKDNKKTQQSHRHALSLPPKVRADADATEMVRAWIVDQQLVCTLRPEIWEDPGTWGVLLADVAYQIANANADLRGIPAKKTLAGINAAFNKEMPEQDVLTKKQVSASKEPPKDKTSDPKRDK